MKTAKKTLSSDCGYSITFDIEEHDGECHIFLNKYEVTTEIKFANYELFKEMESLVIDPPCVVDSMSAAKSQMEYEMEGK